MDLESQLRAMPRPAAQPEMWPLPATQEGSQSASWEQAARFTLLSSRVRTIASSASPCGRGAGRFADACC